MNKKEEKKEQIIKTIKKLITSIMYAFIVIGNYALFGFLSIVYYEVRKEITIPFWFFCFIVLSMMNCMYWSYAYIKLWEEKEE